MLNFCNICPCKCNADRNGNKTGRCGQTNDIVIAKYYLHPYEEPIVSGTKGSGTVFFSGCALKCAFCQNYELSRSKTGKTITVKELANIFKTLEDEGAENINLVTPSHYAYKIIEALDVYRPKIPIVYNTHAYESVDTLKDLDKYIDVYLPDLKFKNSKISSRYTGISDYFSVASKSIEFMMNAKKTVVENGIIKSGVIVRHLILPLCADDSVDILQWFKTHQKNGAYFSLMSQYTPIKNFDTYKELNRTITPREYLKVLDSIDGIDESKCFIQQLSSAKKDFIPKWDF